MSVNFANECGLKALVGYQLENKIGRKTTQTNFENLIFN